MELSGSQKLQPSDVQNNVSDITPKIVDFLEAAESSVEELSVSSGVRQCHNKSVIASCQASLIAIMKDTTSRLELPDLDKFVSSDPQIMASELIKMFDNEEGHLRTLCENQANDSKDMANEIKNQSSKLEMIDGIQNGLNDRNTLDVDKLKGEINELKKLNKQLKTDFDTICAKLCPTFKDDIKRIFSALEVAHNSADEEDRWVDLMTLDCKMDALNLLMVADIVEVDHDKMRIRFVSVD